MRKAILCVGLLLVLLGVTDVAAESYRVILKNGSWVEARDKPEMDGGNARIRLAGGGVAVVPGSSVDWDATARWNRPEERDQSAPTVDVSPSEVEVPSGTITMVREEDKAPAPEEEGEGEGGDGEEVGETAVADDVPQPPPANLSEKRQRYNNLEEELGRLRRQKRELESRASNVVDLDEAAELRGRAADLETRIQQILAQQKNLIIEGDTATVNVGDDTELRRRIRFLNAEISKLRGEKAQLDRQAHSSVNLDDAKVLRGKSDNLFSRIQAHEAERDRLTTRLSQQQ